MQNKKLKKNPPLTWPKPQDLSPKPTCRLKRGKQKQQLKLLLLSLAFAVFVSTDLLTIKNDYQLDTNNINNNDIDSPVKSLQGQSSDKIIKNSRFGWLPQVNCAGEGYILRRGSQKVVKNSELSKNDTSTNGKKVIQTGSSNKTANGTSKQIAKVANLQPQQRGKSLIKIPHPRNPQHQYSDSDGDIITSPSQVEDDGYLTRQQQVAGGGGLQISITPRVSQIRVPVESNTILKCLISSQVNKFMRKFTVHWSRYMYDENVFEQIDSFTGSEGYDRDNSSSSQEQQSGHLPAASELIAGRQEQPEALGLSRSEAELTGSGDILRQQQPFNRQQQLRDFLARSRQETNQISDLLIEATLSIGPVKASDNATYYCTATDGLVDQNRARIDLIALSPPVVQLERVRPARDSKSALVVWLVLSTGNTPIKRTILMVRNESSAVISTQQAAAPEAEVGSGGARLSSVIDADNNQWQRIDIPDEGDPLPAQYLGATDNQPAGAQSRTHGPQSAAAGGQPTDFLSSSDSLVVRADVDVTSSGMLGHFGSDQPPTHSISTSGSSAFHRHRGGDRRQRSFNLSNLLPGVTYHLRLAAINDMGQSNWTHLSATMPNEIPAQISEVFVLSQQNDSLAIGWRRPSWDGAKTVRYEMQLFDLNRTLTLDANTNTAPQVNSSSQQPLPLRTNFMYYFVNLNPGTDYHFHVRACSLAGCSAFSSPKLLASTLDGEPEEPIEVELSCHLTSGAAAAEQSTGDGPTANAIVSWLPPLNPRGQLLNYSLHFHSHARHLNASGQWQVDEWRSVMDTGDNHTLSMELSSGLLFPNTNYSVRVCANNRSKRCGRLSPLSQRTQCTTLPEMPAHLPAGLSLKWRSSTDDRKQEGVTSGAESLAVELPYVSRRNGTLDCIQFVLIRLPPSYAPNSSPLSQFLPPEPSDIRLVPYGELLAADREAEAKKSDQQMTGNPAANKPMGRRNEQALAYLAEEIDEQQVVRQTVAVGDQRLVVLGDGRSQQCRSLATQLGSGSGSPGNQLAISRPLDGSLKPSTYYTGFVRFLMLRPRSPANSAEGSQISRQQKKRQITTTTRSLRLTGESEQELLVKYSDYFGPVKTGPSVMMLPNLAEGDASSLDPTSGDGTPMGELSRLASKVGSALKIQAQKVYQSAGNFVADNFKLESIGNYIMHSSPLMQLLQVGVIVFALSLFLLFLIYLISLPGSMRRKRKRKLKRQLQKHQEAAAAAQVAQSAGPNSLGFSDPHIGKSYQVEGQLAAPSYQEANGVPVSGGTMRRVSDNNGAGDMQAIASGIGYHQVQAASINNLDNAMHVAQQQQPQHPVYGQTTTLARTGQTECPIHSSPMGQQPQQSQDQLPVHVCQPMTGNYGSAAQQAVAYGHTHGHHHHHHHQHSAHPQQQLQYTTDQCLAERNCRTMSRQRPIGQNHNATGSYLDELMVNSGRQQADEAAAYLSNGELMVKQNFTLSHHSSVLALAKKINKSIPLNLFGAIFECRLRNGWLREEYEQLPRQRIMPQADALTNGQVNGSGGQLLRLRPQLIVSRNDQVSALISGNDQFDASLIKNPIASAGNHQTKGADERRIICAKSPLDADSVWDFWRLIYEQEVSTMVMLTQTEDQQTGELRCAQYWPTCDNEETTILSPCNEFVQKSDILPAKFKIRQETLPVDEDAAADFRIRRLTLMVMATRPGENEADQQQQPPQSAPDKQTDAARDQTDAADDQSAGDLQKDEANGQQAQEEDEEDLVIVERQILHLQHLYWNTSSMANQMRLIKFIEMANERHLKENSQSSPEESPVDHQVGTMLVHCSNGTSRSGLFTAMSFMIDDLSHKLSQYQQQQQQVEKQPNAQIQLPKLNLFQLVSRLRVQRDMLLSPYRFYELLYQLTLNCIPSLDHHHRFIHHNHIGR